MATAAEDEQDMVPTPDILVVDDHTLDSQSMLVALEHVAPHAAVMLLESGQKALEYVFAVGEFHGRAPGQPRLVLLTAELETISGLCVLDLMRAHPATCEVPIVLFGRKRDVRKHRRHDRFDADAYVVRPRAFWRLRGVMKGCVRRWLPDQASIGSSRSATLGNVSME